MRTADVVGEGPGVGIGGGVVEGGELAVAVALEGLAAGDEDGLAGVDG